MYKANHSSYFEQKWIFNVGNFVLTKSLEGLSEQELDWEPGITPRTTPNFPSTGSAVYSTVSNQGNSETIIKCAMEKCHTLELWFGNQRAIGRTVGCRTTLCSLALYHQSGCFLC